MWWRKVLLVAVLLLVGVQPGCQSGPGHFAQRVSESSFLSAFKRVPPQWEPPLDDSDSDTATDTHSTTSNNQSG